MVATATKHGATTVPGRMMSGWLQLLPTAEPGWNQDEKKKKLEIKKKRIIQNAYHPDSRRNVRMIGSKSGWAILIILTHADAWIIRK